MSFFDKIVAAMTPPESEETRLEARAHARDVAAPGDWLSQILDHHERIERAFADVKSAADAVAQRAAQKDLAVILTGHSNAEEAVIYPALADAGEALDVREEHRDVTELPVRQGRVRGVRGGIGL